MFFEGRWRDTEQLKKAVPRVSFTGIKILNVFVDWIWDHKLEASWKRESVCEWGNACACRWHTEVYRTCCALVAGKELASPQ